MKSKDAIIINKILKYINELYDFIDGFDYDKFCMDKKTINACVFNLSQIGELVGKVSNEYKKKILGIEWRGLKSLRNRIVHDYDGINLSMIWGFLENELIDLENQLKSIL